jgi:hypothetical protein
VVQIHFFSEEDLMRLYDRLISADGLPTGDERDG